MNKRFLFLLTSAALFLFSACSKQSKPLLEPSLIPMPAQVELASGAFNLKGSTVAIGGETDSTATEMNRLADLLIKGIKDISGIEPRKEKASKADILLELISEPGISTEGYRLVADKQGIKLQASSTQGLFYGMQTLLQLTDAEGRVHYAGIMDEPRFEYRGLHLDVSRHFMSIAYIKEMLDLMASYKYNRFHWHLTDGGGWRMESEKYPLLTQKAQARMVSDWDEWWSKGDRKFVETGTPGSYGGYYTQDEIREVVRFAADRYITVIPEIELPGHSNEVFAAYPELNCLGRWDHDCSDFCIGNPKTFEFLENILDETMALFPSKYIHIGGDEAGKWHWKSCPKCQALMRAEGLKNVDELQSYAVKRIEKYLNGKGREIIGWDEILEGGLAPNATVMSWRGEEGGKTAARMGHHVIMTPGNPLYFDFYQGNPVTEPKAIGGYNPLKRVYAYDPEPADLTAEEHQYILGAQGNLWTEYVVDEKHAAYMIWPRALALAEVLWTPKDKKDFDNFLSRANVHTAKMLEKGINAFPLKNIDLRMEVDTLKKEIRIYADTEKRPCTLRYTIDGTAPKAQSPLYDSAIIVKDSAKLMVQLFDGDKPLFDPVPFFADYHKALGKPVRYNCKFDRGYPAGGAMALTDGYRGSWTYLDKRWQGFTETMDVTVDLGSVQPLNSVSAKFMQAKGAWVYMPETVEAWVSADGKDFTSLGQIPTTVDIDDVNLRFEVFKFNTTAEARYVRMKAVQSKIKNYFLFADEIIVY
ncbi:glycoside hydrolase family 20 protein [Porphyromonas macacae]|uniref:glycoside hydrolase family 20 protein n=1 Tax=Porphyromonas macacae TaxID=28115 RepID=UPI0024AE6B8A|nr:family 20 glycosylhydrolase [Porphyromonas macacae]